MRYKGVAVGLEYDGHPVQCLSHSLDTIKVWAVEIARVHRVVVQIYELVDTLIVSVEPK